MISFRYHVVSIVAVFLALALGIVVGTTALNGPITDDLRKRVDAANSDRSKLQQQLDLAQSQNSDSDSFVSQFGPLVVKDVLQDQKVLVVVLPGGGSIEGRVADEIASAGGTVSSTVTMTGDFFDTARAADIKSLVTNGTLPLNFQLPENTDSAVALGSALLAYVLVGKATDTELAQTVSAFSALQVLTASGATVTPATRVVVVGGGAASDKDTAQGEATFASAFQQKGATVVVAGDGASATDGVISAIRDDDTLDKTLTTVDDADAAMGEISTVLALTDGAQVGAYGNGTKADSPYPKLTS